VTMDALSLIIALVEMVPWRGILISIGIAVWFYATYMRAHILGSKLDELGRSWMGLRRNSTTHRVGRLRASKTKPREKRLFDTPFKRPLLKPLVQRQWSGCTC
jgi:hypothetical protein